MKSNYVAPEVTFVYFKQDVITSSGTTSGIPEGTDFFDPSWISTWY